MRRSFVGGEISSKKDKSSKDPRAAQMGDGTLAALKATVLWVGGSQLEMEAVRQAVGAHQAEFIALPNNANARRWLHMFESRVPLTCIVTNRTRAEDGGDMVRAFSSCFFETQNLISCIAYRMN